jgi:hypothetical protein
LPSTGFAFAVSLSPFGGLVSVERRQQVQAASQQNTAPRAGGGILLAN